MKITITALTLAILIRRSKAVCPPEIDLQGECNYDAVVAALPTGCTLDELFPNQDAATVIPDLCKYDAPVQFVEIQGTYQKDRTYFDGGGTVTDGELHFDMATARMNRFITNPNDGMNHDLIGWPDYAQREDYNKDNGFGDNGYMTNFNIDPDAPKGSCKLNTAMCCFVESAKDPLVDNTDICRHDLSLSYESNHINEGWSIFSGDEAAHCVGFTWKEGTSSDTYKGNALFFASMYQTVVKGYMGNVPGAPMCACLEQMPVVSKADCVQAEGTNLNYKLLYNGFTTHSTVDSCPQNGDAHAEQCSADSEEHAVNCCKTEEDNSLTCLRPDCVDDQKMTFLDAKAHCESNGMRLCTVAELNSNACCAQGCGFDSDRGWAADECGIPDVSATSSVDMTYGTCVDSDLKTHVKKVHSDSSIAGEVEQYLVGDGNCETSNADYLNDVQLLLPTDTTEDKSKNLDGVTDVNGITWKQVFGEGVDFLPPKLNPEDADEELRSHMEGCLSADTPRHCLVRRRCRDCTSDDHKDIIYKRYTPLPPFQEGAATQTTMDVAELFMNKWMGHNNRMGVDYDLFSSVSDAMAGINKWEKEDYNTNPDHNYGFPRNSGPKYHVGDQWNSYKWSGGSANNHAFYVEVHDAAAV